MSERTQEVVENHQISPEEAVKALAEDKERRIKACGEELNYLLQKYKCHLVTQQIWINGMPKGPSEIAILAND